MTGAIQMSGTKLCQAVIARLKEMELQCFFQINYFAENTVNTDKVTPSTGNKYTSKCVSDVH